MRKQLYVLVLMLLPVTFSGCRDADAEVQISELEDQLGELEAKLYNIENEFNDVLSGMRSLESEIDDFDFEDWSDNVPEVIEEFEDLKKAIKDVKNEI
tara:strand:- start:65 stop:358 length:294 start_codon:yes stop_codon:yes gene_type:complete